MKKLITTLIVLIGVMFVLSNAEAQSGKTKATWLWNTYTITDEQTITFIVEKEVTSVYLQIDPSLPNEMYADFIGKMNTAGIEVQALDGAPDWDTTYFDTLWEWLSQYQESYPDAPFTAVHLDVEPYLSEFWESNEPMAIYQYQELLQHAMEQAHTAELKLEVDIPFWYDEVLYKNTFGKGNLAEWIIKNVDGISIMAYRNTVPALKRVTENEMKYAKKYETPVVIGVETIPFPKEPEVSFSAKGEKRMNGMLSQINKHYANHRYFDGVAVHHVDSWMGMKK
ncbi:hypothetical protein [Bacillus ndiopicus]|uniref:hypothetical protein n=1 Tax=Bacillus ndiopicus TaxID=1347368 RepID=UPI0005A8E6B8|nr:hypothetical protein [Bacillus ndiopicus]